jgi:hypothetical protein
VNPHPHLEASWRDLELAEDGPIANTLRELSPIKGEVDRFNFDLIASTFERPKYSERECVRFGMTLAAANKLTVRLVVWDNQSDEPSIDNIIEQEIYNGEAPVRTELGTVVVDGVHRAIRSELAPLPGLFPFEHGWRAGFEWGDHIDLVYTPDGLELTARVAEDGVASLLAHAPAFNEAPKKKKATIVEPPLPRRARIETEKDAIAFYEAVRMPTSLVAHESVPRALFDGEFEAWSFADFLRVLEWLKSDEARKIARDEPSPVRVIGPGLVLARWLRRGIFVTAQQAVARANALTFGTREKPHKTPNFSWHPHDTWNATPAMTLLRARLASEAYAPRVRVSHPLETADLLRSVRVPSYLSAPESWETSRVAKVTVADLPLLDSNESGWILRPNNRKAPSLSASLSLGSSLATRTPLSIEAPEPSPIESSTAPAVASLGGAIRSALSTQRGSAVSVLAVDPEDGASIVVDDRGSISWVEPQPLYTDDDCVREERGSVAVGPLSERTILATTHHERDGTLALGRTVRIGFDLRVPEGGLWLSTHALGERAFCADRARIVERSTKDTRLGAEAWEGATSRDSLAAVGQRVASGDELGAVLVPIPLDDDPRTPERKLLDAIDGRAPNSRRDAVRWTGPDATVIDRWIVQRRGREDTAPIARDRARAAATIARRRSIAEGLEEPQRSDALEALREFEWRLERGADLPPGVISVTQWTLRWSEPVVRGSALATLSGHTYSIDRIINQRFFEGTSAVDALLHPSALDRVRDEALATAAVAKTGERLSVEPGTRYDAVLRARSLDAMSDGPYALYFLRTR